MATRFCWVGFSGLLFTLGFHSFLRAGSPPLITDDPGTPGNGHWEINIGASTDHRPGARNSEFPLVDLNYGIGDRFQLNYEVPYTIAQEDGGTTKSGLGNSALGVKWRFYDAGERALSMSVYPKIEFNTPGSSAADHGLVDAGTVFLLPCQFEKEVGPFTLIWQVGREFHSGSDPWFYGISVGHRITKSVELAVELAGGATAGFHRSQLTANFGVCVDLSERSSLMFSLGRELHNHHELCATLISYVGWQLRL